MLLDLWLGAESGLDALPEMLRRQPSAGVTVVTAVATFESAVEALKRGAADSLPNPFTPDQGRLAVQRVVDEQRLRRRVSELEQQIESFDADAWFRPPRPSTAAAGAAPHRFENSERNLETRSEFQR